MFYKVTFISRFVTVFDINFYQVLRACLLAFCSIVCLSIQVEENYSVSLHSPMAWIAHLPFFSKGVYSP